MIAGKSGRAILVYALLAVRTIALGTPTALAANAEGAPPLHSGPWPIHNGRNYQPTEDELRALHLENVTPDQAREINPLYDQLLAGNRHPTPNIDGVVAENRCRLRAKPWIELTGPSGEPIHINVEQIASIRSDTEVPGARTQLDFASGKFQGVQENVEQVMQLISASSGTRENAAETPSAAPKLRRPPRG